MKIVKGKLNAKSRKPNAKGKGDVLPIVRRLIIFISHLWNPVFKISVIRDTKENSDVLLFGQRAYCQLST